MRSKCSSSIHPVSSIFATDMGINGMFLQEIHMGINWHRQTPDKMTIVYIYETLYTSYCGIDEWMRVLTLVTWPIWKNGNFSTWPINIEFKTLLSLSSAFFKKPHFFLCQAIQPAVLVALVYWSQGPIFLLSANFQARPCKLLGSYKFCQDPPSWLLC